MTSIHAWITVLAFLALPGCHLVFPFSVQDPNGPDSSQADSLVIVGDAKLSDSRTSDDTGSILDSEPLDQTPLDQIATDQATPDAGLPDSAPIDVIKTDSPGTYYMNEEFNSTMGAVTACWGTWQPGAGAVMQSDINTWGSFASGPALPGPDYIAETHLTIINHGGVPLLSYVGGALSFRVQTPCVTAKPARGYYCMVTPALPGLILGMCDNGGKCSSLDFQQFSVSKAVLYRVRIAAKGNNLTCELPDLAISLTSSDSTYTSGDLALSTFFAEVSFDDLKAWATP